MACRPIRHQSRSLVNDIKSSKNPSVHKVEATIIVCSSDFYTSFKKSEISKLFFETDLVKRAAETATNIT